MCSPLLFACNNKTQAKVLKRLATPTNVQFDESLFLVSWDSVEKADFYNVMVNGKAHQSTQTELNIAEFVSESGEYAIQVSACSFSSEYIESALTTAIYLEKREKWGTPTICYDEDESLVFWEPVDDAVHYTLVVNGIEFDTMQTSFCVLGRNIFDDVLVDGDNTFSVYCSTTSEKLNGDMSNVLVVNIYLP